MAIASELPLTVAFVCIRRHNPPSLMPVGTAFFMGHIEKQHLKMYAITARHVIDGVKERYGIEAVVLTYNGKSDREELEIPIDQWSFHPDQTHDYIDVAVTRFAYDFSIDEPSVVNPHQIRYWLDHALYGHQSKHMPNLRMEGLQVGEDVLIAGLFVHYSGLTRNIPIVRTGNVAALPTEPVRTKQGDMSALLVEIRSIGGLSGSPVIRNSGIGQPSILGLVHGHFDHKEKDLTDIEDGVSQTNAINAGIAIVVPARFIEQTLAPLIQEDFPA